MANYQINPFTKQMERVDRDGNLGNSPITESGNISLSQEFILVDCTLKSISLLLPYVTGNKGKIYHIKKIDNSRNYLYIKVQSGDTIEKSTELIVRYQFDAPAIIAGPSKSWSIF